MTVRYYFPIVNVVLITVVTFFAAQLFGKFVALKYNRVLTKKIFESDIIPDVGFSKSRSSYDQISLRNIFDVEDTLNREKAARNQKIPDLTPPPLPTLDLTSEPVLSDINAVLIGTFLRGDVKDSTAIIEANGVAKRYRVGDMILDESEIIDIGRRKVYFIRNYHREYLEIGKRGVGYTPPPTPIQYGNSAPVSDQETFEIAKDAFDDALSRIDEILYDAASLPNMVDGKIEGFKILYITPGSIYDELGIEDGDIIMKVNGTGINSVESALNLFNTLKNESKFDIEVKRGDSLKTFSYSVK